MVGPGLDAPDPPPPQLTTAATLRQRAASNIACPASLLLSRSGANASSQPNPKKNAAAIRPSRPGFEGPLKLRLFGNAALAAVVETVTWKGTGKLLNTDTSDGARKQVICAGWPVQLSPMAPWI